MTIFTTCIVAQMKVINMQQVSRKQLEAHAHKSLSAVVFCTRMLYKLTHAHVIKVQTVTKFCCKSFCIGNKEGAVQYMRAKIELMYGLSIIEIED